MSFPFHSAITAIELAVGEPPHSNVHPMRAIFMIPNSDPPTLPDPSKWSVDFNDFLKVCLVKNPDKRPSATQLLKSHPFITKAKSKAIIAQLVDECMQEIDEYRAQEAQESAQNAATGTAAGADTGTLQHHVSSTLSSPSSSGTMLSNNGTMVHNPAGSDLPSPSFNSSTYDQGTMVFNTQGGVAHGTLQAGQHQDFLDEHGGMDTGTMVLHGTIAKPPSATSSLHEGMAGVSVSGGAAARAKYEEPSYMRHIREASNKFKNAPVGSVATASGTMVLGATTIPPSAGHAAASAASVPLPVPTPRLTPSDFLNLYRTSRRFDPTQLESLNAAELKAALTGLEAAHQAEKKSMEQTYEETKKMLKQTMEKRKK